MGFLAARWLLWLILGSVFFFIGVWVHAGIWKKVETGIAMGDMGNRVAVTMICFSDGRYGEQSCCYHDLFCYWG